jgi:predicted lipase
VPVPPEFLTEKQLVKSKAKGALVHFGFQQTYTEGLRDIIQPAISTAAKTYPSYKIVFTGHSLGAALTELAAVDYHKNSANIDEQDRIRLINYASPRVGNQEWASFIDSLSFSKKSYRLARYGDIISHLPPVLLSYRHSFQQYSILPNNQVLSCEKYKAGSHDCLDDDFWEMGSNLKKNLHDSASYLSYFNQTFTCKYLI